MSFFKEVGKALMALGASRFFKIRSYDVVLRFYPTKMSLVMWVDQFHRRCSYEDEANLFRSYLEAGDVVVDIGANIGLFTVVSAQCVGPKGRVYAIEAHPRTYRYLQGNVQANRLDHVKTYHLAMGERGGSVVISDRQRDNENAVSSKGDGFEVQLMRLDKLGIEEEVIHLLKIDVEGYEKFVLEGGGALLARVQCIFIEFYGENFQTYGYTGFDLLELLMREGYRVFRQEGRCLKLLGPDYIGSQCENLIAVRSVEDFIRRTGYQLDSGSN